MDLMSIIVQSAKAKSESFIRNPEAYEKKEEIQLGKLFR